MASECNKARWLHTSSLSISIRLGSLPSGADALAGIARFVGGALADDPGRRRTVAVGGYASTAVLSSAIGLAGAHELGGCPAPIPLVPPTTRQSCHPQATDSTSLLRQ